mmetsp:Transcript_96916/g.278383  ORF Transcript_96916/g.278383 Transcript_96916/m.278383 type:complete len:231 (-) Transcript_96916:1463-2155(-)
MRSFQRKRQQRSYCTSHAVLCHHGGARGGQDGWNDIGLAPKRGLHNCRGGILGCCQKSGGTAVPQCRDVRVREKIRHIVVTSSDCRLHHCGCVVQVDLGRLCTSCKHIGDMRTENSAISSTRDNAAVWCRPHGRTHGQAASHVVQGLRRLRGVQSHVHRIGLCEPVEGSLEGLGAVHERHGHVVVQVQEGLMAVSSMHGRWCWLLRGLPRSGSRCARHRLHVCGPLRRQR